MDNIEQLKQDNAKLTERLNNAAKFFREQKAQIESLTKENKELKDQINRTPQEEVIDTEKWNKLVTEKENLNKQLNEYKLKLQSVENNESQANWEAKCEELEKTIQSKDLAYKVLQDTYNEVFAEKEKITKQYKEQEKFETEVINKKVPELEEKLKGYENEFKSLNAVNDDLNKQLDNYELKVQNLENTINSKDKEYKEAEESAKKIMDSYEKEIKDQKDEITVLNTNLGELEEKFNGLNIKYDKCENEKLAIQSDFNNLQEKYKNLECNISNDHDRANHFETVLTSIKNTINDVLNVKSVQVKKENIMKRTGDFNTSVNNVGV